MRRYLLASSIVVASLACNPGSPGRSWSDPKPAPITVRGPTPPPASTGKLKILAIAAHPDDAESAVGGTLARYAEAGHDVHVLYVTKGELGIVGKTPDEAGAVRAAEAEKACRALGATAHFFGHPSGKLAYSVETLRDFIGQVDAIAPDIMFGHWPMDPDFDHEVSAMLTIHAYLAKPRTRPLYLFEVEAGTQSLGFVPQAYVEIGPVVTKKLAAIRAHESQYAERRLYERHHEPMQTFRAREIGGTAAEAFYVLAPDAKMLPLPGL